MFSSSNLSKAAWGTLEKNGSQLMIRSYEIGVLFLPKDFDADYFVINGCHAQSDSKSHASKPVTVPFDLPVTPYCKDGKILHSLSVRPCKGGEERDRVFAVSLQLVLRELG